MSARLAALGLVAGITVVTLVAGCRSPHPALTDGRIKRRTGGAEPVLEVRRAHDPDTGRLIRKWSAIVHADGTAVLHGVESTWFADGKLQAERGYHEGLRDDSWKVWFPGGQIESERHYDRGEPTGTWTTWFRNGVPRTEVIHGPEGKSSYWYESGQLKARGSTVNDRRFGPWTFWYPDGTKREEGPYVDNQRSGAWTSWWPDGSERAAGEYAGGKRVGQWKLSPRPEPEGPGSQ